MAHHQSGGVGEGPSPLLAQTLLEALASVCFSYVGIDGEEALKSGTGGGLVRAFTIQADGSNSTVTDFIEFVVRPGSLFFKKHLSPPAPLPCPHVSSPDPCLCLIACPTCRPMLSGKQAHTGPCEARC